MKHQWRNANSIVSIALKEDIGDGDLTTLACVDPDITGEASIVCKSGGVMAGQGVALQVFKAVDDNLVYSPKVSDGEKIDRGDVVATIEGSIASILIAERVALNFLMRLSGIASLTRKYVEAVDGTNARILDTRKTTPGLRELEKHAVLCGGGMNHRIGLYDMILIKDNHIHAAGSVPEALRKCNEYVRNADLDVPIEVEAASDEEIEQAIEAGAGWIMLDNMSREQIIKAVDKIRKASRLTKIEVSGGVSLSTVREFAECGVDYISVGALTHSATSLDFSLNISGVA